MFRGIMRGKPGRNARTRLDGALGGLAYGAATAAILLIGWTLYMTTKAMAESSAWVDQSLEILEEISRFAARRHGAEAAHRGLLLTDGSEFAAERDSAIAAARQSLARLHETTRDNPHQQARVARLTAVLAYRVTDMYKDEQARRQFGLAAAAARMAENSGQASRNAMTELTSQLRAEERGLLEQRRSMEAQIQSAAKWKLFAAGALILLVMVPAYIAFVVQGAARRRAESLVRDLTENLPGAVFQYRAQPDGTSAYEFLSQGTARLRGVDVERALADPMVLINTIVEEDRPRVLAALAESQGAVGPLDQEYRVRTADGTTRWIRTTANARKGSGGSVLLSGQWTDITEKRELQQALLESRDTADAANRAKSTFLATMSHEIRTPMNGVLGMLELLSLTELTLEQRTTLNVIRESGRSLVRIIDDILDFSKIEAGKLELRPEPASLANVVERVRDIYLGNASSKGLVLLSRVDRRIAPSLMMDAQRVQQILNNLVANAIKFTSRGEITIDTQLVERRDGRESVRIAVIDTGIGLSEQDAARMFAPFAQAEEGRRHVGGTGLGLSICRRLVEMMGGTIRLQSRLGVGTEVIVEVALPIAQTPPEAAAQKGGMPSAPLLRRAPPSIDAAIAEGSLVLVVDDHPINRMVLHKQVNALGFAVETAEDGLQALEMWSTGRFALVLTDCNMPEMDGYQLAREIRECEKQNHQPQTPIIACTANAVRGEVDNCLAAGMNDYLSKPVALAGLAEKLRAWLPKVAEMTTPRAAPHPPSASSPIDDDVLAEVAGGDAANERDLLSRFGGYNQRDAELLRAAVRSADLAEAARVAHKIKGAARTIGARPLADACAAVEAAARAADAGRVEQLQGGFERELQRLREHLQARGERQPRTEET